MNGESSSIGLRAVAALDGRGLGSSSATAATTCCAKLGMPGGPLVCFYSMGGPRSDHGNRKRVINLSGPGLRRSIEQMISVATQGLVEAFRGSASLSAVFRSLLPMCATLKTLERIAPPIPSYAPGNKRRCSITQGNCTWMVDPCLFLSIRALSRTRYASSSPQASPVKPKVVRR